MFPHALAKGERSCFDFPRWFRAPGCCAYTEALGHQLPADGQAVHLLPDFLEALDEVVAGAWREENRRPAVSTGSDELQLTRAVSAMVDRHAGFEDTRGLA